jgi:tight adherence protein B
MIVLFLFAVVISLAMVASSVSLSRQPRKATNRRIEAIKARHAGGVSGVELQLRRITAQRASALDDTFARLLPNPDLLRKRIEMTGKSWTLGQYAVASAILTVTVWVVFGVIGVPVLLTLFLGLLGGIGLPYWWIGRLAKKRQARFIARFPDAIELLVRGLRSGLPISETIAVVGNELPDPVGTEFRAAADKMRIGRTMEQALQETAERINTPEIQFFVITLAIQRETGGNLAETLGNLAEVLRKRMQMKLKIKAMSSESKASAYIIGSLPFIVFGIIYYVNPAYMGGFFQDHRLIVAGAGGGVWMAIGVFIMAKMISFEI